MIVGAKNSDLDLIRVGFRLVDTESGHDMDLPDGVSGERVQIWPVADGKPAGKGPRPGARL
ncbi:hypothetical protein [Actinoplanes sp. CA-252034]|uniref:hypothetical protein n=1 Tax=Actinoplanes sp. CA-252034 TaxID=3239906 RepID=UPI003D97FD87